MSRTLGEIDYDDDAKLIPSRSENTPKPEVIILKNSDEALADSEEREVRNKTKPNPDEVQARYMARRIRELVEKSGPGERLKYSDIGLLYRGINRRAKTVIRIFQEEGVPIIFDGDSEQVEAQEISIFLKLLNLIDNHKQDLPLLTIMHLPIFGFTLDDEVQIRGTYPEAPYFYQAVEAYRDYQNDELSEKLKLFYQRLHEWRELSKHLDLEDFLWQLLLESGFYNYVGNLAGGKERKQNLRLLLERAVSYKDSSLKGLPSFLQFVARLQKRGQVISSSISGADSEDAVQLMSIHKSKGLEFPVVFLADTGRRFNVNKVGDLIYHKDHGYAAKHIELKDNILVKNNTLRFEALKEQLRQDEYSEEMRLLYVAMTRAQNRLILVGTVDDLEKKQAVWEGGAKPTVLLKENSFLDWIMTALNEFKHSAKEEGEGFNTPDWEVSILEAQDYAETEVIEDTGEELEDQSYHELREMIFEKMNAPETEFKNLHPVKMSVSRIKKHGIDSEETVELVPITQQALPKVDPAELGTAIHSFLQHLDFSSYAKAKNKDEELQIQKEAFIDKGVIKEELAAEVDATIIRDFLESDLGQRLLETYSRSPGNVLKEISFSCDMDPATIKDAQNLGDRVIQISGVIDCCFIEDGKWVLLDYKTDRFYTQNIWDQRLEEYSLQVNLYSRALEQLTGLKTGEKHIYFLTEKKDVAVK